MHCSLFNITLKNVHNIKATHGNTLSPIRGGCRRGGGREGSFDINRGTGKKKSVFQLKMPYSCPSASFASAESFISFVSSSSVALCGFHPPTTPPTLGEARTPLPYHLFLKILTTPFFVALPPPQSRGCHLCLASPLRGNNVVSEEG